MIDSDLLIIEDPDDDHVVSVAEHLLRPDGSVRLVLLASNVDDPAMLAGVGGRVTPAGDGVLVAWEWTAAMVPPNRVATCTAQVDEALVAWAAAFLGEPIHLHRLS